jgi:hypothetical protein
MGPDHSEEGYATLNRIILELVAHDFEPFESILDKLSRRPPDTLSAYDVDEIPVILLALVTGGFLRACLIHADSPYITAVDPSLESIEQYWFMITEQGVRYLKNTLAPQTRMFIHGNS